MDAILIVGAIAGVALALVKRLYHPIIEYLSQRADGKPAYEPIIDVLIFAEQYVETVVAGVLVWFSGVNLFVGDLYGQLSPTLGRVLTALVALFAQDVISAVTLWPTRLAEQQYVNAVALREQGVLPVALGTVTYIEKREDK